MSKKCSARGCNRAPQLFCDCLKERYHCPEHFAEHLKAKSPGHKSNSLYVTPDPSLVENLMSSIDLKSQQIGLTSVQLQLRFSEMFTFLQKYYRDTMKMIKKKEKFYKMMKIKLIRDKEIDSEEFESSDLLNTSIKFSASLESAKRRIEQAFTWKFQNENDGRLFWFQDSIFTKIDLSNLKKTSISIQTPFLNHNNVCKISDGTFFFQDYTNPKCYIVDSNLNSYVEVTTLPAQGNMHAIGCIDDKVYILGGHETFVNKSFDLIRNVWRELAPCPKIKHHYSGGVILDKIYITNHTQSPAYSYNPVSNSYATLMNLPTGHWKPVGHGFIFSNQNFYKLNDEGNNWDNFSYTGSPPNFSAYHGNSYVFKRGPKLYAIDHNHTIWQFDTMSSQITKLKIVDS